jgi:hypothetical protein
VNKLVRSADNAVNRPMWLSIEIHMCVKGRRDVFVLISYNLLNKLKFITCVGYEMLTSVTMKITVF